MKNYTVKDKPKTDKEDKKDKKETPREKAIRESLGVSKHAQVIME